MRYVLSLDIETYNKLMGHPVQTCFSPFRAAVLDGVPFSEQVLTCSLTLCRDPRPTPSHPWTPHLVSQLKPAETFVLPLSTLRAPPQPLPDFLTPYESALQSTLRITPSRSVDLLRRYLSGTDTLLGMNLQFDLMFLRRCFPTIRPLLTRDTVKHILDLGYINFLESDVRPERDLDGIGTVLGNHLYSKEDLVEKLSCPLRLFWYNAQDTHNTVLDIASLARRIITQYPNTDKLSDTCIAHFTNLIFTVIEMTENGVPMSTTLLTDLAAETQSAIASATAAIPFPNSGPGSQAHQREYLRRLYDLALSYNPDLIHDKTILYTPTTKELSYCEANLINLFKHIPESDPAHASIKAINSAIIRESAASKLWGTYIFPLLWRKRRKPYSLSSRLIPNPLVPNPTPLPPCPEPIPQPKGRSSSRSTSKAPRKKSPSGAPRKKSSKKSSEPLAPLPSSTEFQSETSALTIATRISSTTLAENMPFDTLESLHDDPHTPRPNPTTPENPH